MEELPPALIEELELDEIAELLEELDADLSPEELRATAIFVKQLGGIDEAFAAIEALEQSKAA